MMKSKVRNTGLISRNGRRAACAALACVSALLAAVLSAGPAGAQTYSETLAHVFTGPDGSFPGTLLAGSGGNFYGTASGGPYDSGEIYKISKTGALTVFYTFGPPPDGSSPGGLIQDPAGNLYGVTVNGGTHSDGTIFKLDPAGKETVLYNFAGGSDGRQPTSLIRDAAGNLYGTTYEGGTAGLGTVFKFSAAGVESVLHSFTGPPDGETPSDGLVRDTAGNLYGVTVYGGSPPTCYSSGCGTIFEITARGQEIVLYNFTDGSDGENPNGGMIRDGAGNLYGTTLNGGSGDGGYCCGTLFKLSPKGKLTVLYAFYDNGTFPLGGLIRDSAGNLYGTTWMGGAGPCSYGGFYYYGCGSVYELSSSGQESMLYGFMGAPDGEYPSSTLVRDAAGNLYGVASEGGDAACDPPYGCGTVFKLTPP